VTRGHSPKRFWFGEVCPEISPPVEGEISPPSLPPHPHFRKNIQINVTGKLKLQKTNLEKTLYLMLKVNG
jgi:hypothetical protein